MLTASLTTASPKLQGWTEGGSADGLSAGPYLEAMPGSLTHPGVQTPSLHQVAGRPQPPPCLPQNQISRPPVSSLRHRAPGCSPFCQILESSSLLPQIHRSRSQPPPSDPRVQEPLSLPLQTQGSRSPASSLRRASILPLALTQSRHPQ